MDLKSPCKSSRRSRCMHLKEACWNYWRSLCLHNTSLKKSRVCSDCASLSHVLGEREDETFQPMVKVLLWTQFKVTHSLQHCKLIWQYILVSKFFTEYYYPIGYFTTWFFGNFLKRTLNTNNNNNKQSTMTSCQHWYLKILFETTTRPQRVCSGITERWDHWLLGCRQLLWFAVWYVIKMASDLKPPFDAVVMTYTE